MFISRKESSEFKVKSALRNKFERRRSGKERRTSSRRKEVEEEMFERQMIDSRVGKNGIRRERKL
jgi:hypothetical protein